MKTYSYAYDARRDMVLAFDSKGLRTKYLKQVEETCDGIESVYPIAATQARYEMIDYLVRSGMDLHELNGMHNEELIQLYRNFIGYEIMR